MSLPSGYKRLLFIESSGGAYVDSRFKPNQDSVLELDVAFLGSAGSNIAGVRNTVSDATNRFGIITFGSASKIGAFFRDSSIQAIAFDNNRHSYKLSKSGLYVDSTMYGSPNSGAFACTYNFILFGWNNGSSGIEATKSRVYSCKFSERGIYTRDYFPCQTTSGEIGLWDDVNSVFYGNAGTGTFIAGPVVTSPSIFVNIDGIWKPINNIYANINNIWQQLT